MKKKLYSKSLVLNKETISSIHSINGGGDPPLDVSYPACGITYGPSVCWSCVYCGKSGGA